jgi:hypothetical protein
MPHTLWSLAGAIYLLTAVSAHAQDPAGAIEGAVADPSGAVVAAARVTVKNTGTGLARERDRLGQFRAESFNVTNHANVGIPVADLNSANFGRVFSAGPPRLTQFALKLMF